jgi:WD40 repeat protein
MVMVRRVGLVIGWLACLAIATGGMGAEPPITAVTLTPDGREVLIGSQAGIELRTWPEMGMVAKVATGLEHVHDLAFAPDGKTLAVAGGTPGESGAVELWDWAGRRKIRSIGSHDDVVYRVAWSPDGERIASAGGDGICQVSGRANGGLVVNFSGHSGPVLSVRYLDAMTLASAGVDQTVRLWDGADGRLRRTLDNHVGVVNDIAVSPVGADGVIERIITIGEDRTVRLWQPRIGRMVRFTKLDVPPRCIAWSKDGRVVFVGGEDGVVRQFDVEGGLKVVGQTEGGIGRIHEMVLDPRGDRVLVGGEHGYRVIPVAK